MLINLPNEMIGYAIARKLMSYFIIKDKNTGMKVMLCEMNTNMKSGQINSKYYPITGNESWLSIFTDERDNAIRVPRDVVESLMDKNVSNTDLMNYAKAVSVIYAFTSVTMHSSRDFKAPNIDKIINEINIKKEKKEEEGN